MNICDVCAVCDKAIDPGDLTFSASGNPPGHFHRKCYPRPENPDSPRCGSVAFTEWLDARIEAALVVERKRIAELIRAEASKEQIWEPTPRQILYAVAKAVDEPLPGPGAHRPTGYPDYDLACAFAKQQWGDDVTSVNFKRNGVYEVGIRGKQRIHLVGVNVGVARIKAKCLHCTLPPLDGFDMCPSCLNEREP